MGPYPISFRPEVHKDLDEIPGNIQKRIKKAIEERLETAPNRYGERLKRSLLGLWKVRSGDYRIIYTILEKNVTVWMIAHRKKVYPRTDIGCENRDEKDGSYFGAKR